MSASLEMSVVKINTSLKKVRWDLLWPDHAKMHDHITDTNHWSNLWKKGNCHVMAKKISIVLKKVMVWHFCLTCSLSF